MFENETFDGVWAYASLVHLAAEDLPHALNEIYRALVPKGKAYISVKGGNQTQQLIEENKYGSTMRRHFTFWNPDYFSDQLNETGFEIESVDIVESIKQNTNQSTWLKFWVNRP